MGKINGFESAQTGPEEQDYLHTIEMYHNWNCDWKHVTRLGVSDCPPLKTYHHPITGLFRVVQETDDGASAPAQPKDIKRLAEAIELASRPDQALE